MANEVREFLAGIAPDKVDIVKESKAKDVFDDRGVHRMIKASFGRQVNLRSGAYLIVEHTEAMHVIDVNSGGRKAGATSQEENATATNLECATEIARLLRLRDMGGIICVDFIDMGETANRRAIDRSTAQSHEAGQSQAQCVGAQQIWCCRDHASARASCHGHQNSRSMSFLQWDGQGDGQHSGDRRH